MSSIVYSMPFSIDIPSSTSSNDIKRYFTNSIQKTSTTNHFEASFRGRPLNGDELSIPSDYIGILTNSSQILSTFDRLTYFNLDCKPTKNDCIVRSVQYLSLAKILHE